MRWTSKQKQIAGSNPVPKYGFSKLFPHRGENRLGRVTTTDLSLLTKFDFFLVSYQFLQKGFLAIKNVSVIQFCLIKP